MSSRSPNWDTHYWNHPFWNRQQVVYSLKCRTCGAIYVGETGQDLGTRIDDHIWDRDHGFVNPVSRHYNIPGHTLERAICEVLEWGPSLFKLERLDLERFWIDEFDSLGNTVLNLRPYYYHY